MSRKDDQKLLWIFDGEFWCRGLTSAWVEALFCAGAFVFLLWVLTRVL